MSKGLLLSGGLDSIALCYWQKPDFAFTIDYGQRPAAAEIRASAQVTRQLGIEHLIISADCSSLGSGDLSDSGAIALAPSSEWWPFRNQLLITLACMKGASMGLSELMIGCVKSDGFHADGSIPFVEKIDQLTQAQEGNIKISAPAIDLTSDELIVRAKVPEEILFWAHSCHVSDLPCGTCRGCQKYLMVMQALGHR